MWTGPAAASDEDFPLDLRSLDELFSQKEARTSQRSGSFRRSLLRCRSPQETGLDKVRESGGVLGSICIRFVLRKITAALSVRFSGTFEGVT